MSPPCMHASYSAQIGTLAADAWDAALSGFDDASIYQTVAYGDARWGHAHLEHVLVLRDGQVRAAAQVAVFRVPVLRAGVAYVPWGPVWRSRDSGGDQEALGILLQTLQQEFGGRRRLLVRVSPAEIAADDSPVEALLQAMAWQRTAKPPHQTLLIDLQQPADMLRKGMSAKWRENLRRAERGAFMLDEGSSDDYLTRFLRLYRQMWERKRFAESINVDRFLNMQARLPENFKMGVMICVFEGHDVAGIVWTAVGKTGIPLFSAVVGAGLKHRAAYYLRWNLMQRLKERGCFWLDQGGVSETANSGGFVFKSGMGGRLVKYVGQYENRDAWLSFRMVRLAEQGKSIASSLKTRFKRRLVPANRDNPA